MTRADTAGTRNSKEPNTKSTKIMRKLWQRCIVESSPEVSSKFQYSNSGYGGLSSRAFPCWEFAIRFAKQLTFRRSGEVTVTIISNSIKYRRRQFPVLAKCAVTKHKFQGGTFYHAGAGRYSSTIPEGDKSTSVMRLCLSEPWCFLESYSRGVSFPNFFPLFLPKSLSHLPTYLWAWEIMAINPQP